ncbi:2'-5' RNA ligase family protein [Nocardia sp. NPDC055321]
MQTSQDSEQPKNGPAKATAFPRSAPRSLSSDEAISKNDWEAFRGIENMENHWTRSVWATDQQTYFWYLTFEDPALATMAASCQDSLDPDGLDFVPVDGLHMTLLKIGNDDLVTHDEIYALADVAKEMLSHIEPFDLSVGPLAGSRGAIRFSASPWSQLFELHQIARTATLTALPNLSPAATALFRPHVGIGYSNRNQPAKPLIDQVSQLRTIAPVKICVDAVRIVKLRRESSAYRWDDVATLGLGANRG